MLQIKQAEKVNAFTIEGHTGLYRKVSAAVADEYKKDKTPEQKDAVQALVGSTISWFIPHE